MSVRLFRIPLIGVGSSEVESLAGYIHRISYEHGVYVGELLRFCHRHAESEFSKPEYPKLPSYVTVAEIIRVNEISDMVLEMFEIMTGQDLKAGTLSWMRHLITRLTGEIHPGFRWCPECFSEMEAMGQEAYFKLIWSVKTVDYCATHRTPLVSGCGQCGCNQTTYIKDYPLSQCQSCGWSLAKRKVRLRAKDVRPSWVAMGSDITVLFKDVTTEGIQDFYPENIRLSLEKVFDHYWRTENEEEFYRVLSRDKLLAIIYKQTPISFRTARLIAFKLGISLHTLLSGNAQNTTAVLDADWFCSLPPGYLESSSRRKNDHRLIIKKVRRLIKKAPEPLSLKALAKKADVSVGYLEYRHPVLVSTVVMAHKNFEDQQRQKKLNLAQSKALEYFTSAKYRGSTQSRKQAYRSIVEETGLPKFMLKKAIKSAYDAVYS